MAPVYASDDLSVPSSSTVVTTTSNGTAGQRSPQLGASSTLSSGPSSQGLGVASGSGSSFQLSQDGAVGLGQRPRTPSPSTSPQEAFFPQNLPSQPPSPRLDGHEYDNDTHPHTAGMGRSTSLPISRSGSPKEMTYDGYPKGRRGTKITPQTVGRAIAARFVRTAKRGNLPFLVVFFSCVAYFFAALAGIGYVPEPVPTPSELLEPEFIPGGPVFDLSDDQHKNALERKMEEQRELEMAWMRKKRPKDGAWMQKQRDDKAVRRVPASVASALAAAANKDGPDMGEMKKRSADELD